MHKGHYRMKLEAIENPASLIDESGLKLVDVCKKLGINPNLTAKILLCYSDDTNINGQQAANLILQRKACAIIENEWGKSTSTKHLLHHFDRLNNDRYDIYYVALIHSYADNCFKLKIPKGHLSKKCDVNFELYLV